MLQGLRRSSTPAPPWDGSVLAPPMGIGACAPLAPLGWVCFDSSRGTWGACPFFHHKHHSTAQTLKRCDLNTNKHAHTH